MPGQVLRNETIFDHCVSDKVSVDILPLSHKCQHALETWFAEIKTPPLVPWWGIGWLNEAKTWMMDQLHSRGITINSPVEQVRHWYGSAILRVNTDVGYVYLKAVAGAFIQEVKTMQIITKWKPQCVPSLLAVDFSRHWILMQGISDVNLGEISEMEVWEEVLRVYAQLQIDALEFIEKRPRDLICDWRLTTMENSIVSVVAEIRSLLRGHSACPNEANVKHWISLIHQVQAMCIRARSYRIPCTLDHGDFHDGMNIQVTEKGPVFYDWAASSITHPFFSVVELLSSDNLPKVPDVKVRLRDAYLERWMAYDSLEHLQELFKLTEQLKVLHWALHSANQLAVYEKN